MKLQLCDAGGSNVSTAAIGITAVNITQISTGASEDVQTPGNSNPDNNFRYDSGLAGYTFNMKTTGLPTGTYLLNFTVSGDTTPHSVGFQVRT